MSDPANRLKADSNGLSDPLVKTTWNRDKYIKVLRVMLSDIKELNALLGSPEFSNDKLGIVLDLVLSDFNGDTPPTNFTFEDFPNPNCLLQGAIAMALDSSCIMHARNALQYSDDGVAFEDFGKDPRFGPLAMKHAQNYLRLSDNMKRMINAGQCFGSFGSEYGWINRIIR